MKRFMMLLCLSGMTYLAATATTSCNQQATSILALMCPECWAHYQALTGK